MQAPLGEVRRDPQGRVYKVTGVGTGARRYLSSLTDEAGLWINLNELETWAVEDPTFWEDD